jgi:predicted nucleic acid-binding protein
MSLSAVLNLAVRDWLSKDDAADGDGEQSRLQNAAAQCFGAFAGTDVDRSEKVRPLLRQRLRRLADVALLDRPMDFAEATPVHLAKREALSTIFTVDIADFETYRIEGRRRFRVVPGTRP